MTTADTTDRKSNPLGMLLVWAVGLLMLTVLALNIASAMGWYTPPAWRATQAQDAPMAPIPTQEPPRAPAAPAVAAPAAPQPVIVQQPAAPAAQPQVVIPPAPASEAAPAPQPEVVYIQTQGGSTVATGSGTNAADGGASTGVCALGKGARRCGR